MTTTLTARQRFAAENRDSAVAAIDLIDGVRLKGLKPPAKKTLFPATAILSDIDKGHSSDRVLFDSEARDAIWPLRVSVLSSPWGDESGRGSITGIRSIGIREAKGRITRPMPRMAEVVMGAWRSNSLKGHAVSQIVGWFPGGDIRNLSTDRLPNLSTAEIANRVDVGAGYQITLDYYWSVVIQNSGSGSAVRIPCSPKTALDFLSLRDVPDGKKRRAAMKHWVTSHVKSTPSGGEVEVASHMRGRQSFKWDGVEGFVEPSPHDVRKLEGEKNA